MIPLSYICGQIMNVILILYVLSNEQNAENFQFVLIYFSVSMLGDLTIYETLLSTSMVYSIFVYTAVYLLGMIVCAIIGYKMGT